MNIVNGMGIWCRKRKITVLKYADNLVLPANTTEGLQSGLDALHSYCITNKLTVNTNKGKIMCLANKVQIISHPYGTTKRQLNGLMSLNT